MAVKFQFVSAFVCERLIQETDGIYSAMRIADVFQVPETFPDNVPMQFWVVVLLRALPIPEDDFRISLTLVRVSGEKEALPVPVAQPLKVTASLNDPSIPAGINMALQMNIIPKNFGTCYIEVAIDEEIVARAPFTFRRLPAAAPVVAPPTQ